MNHTTHADKLALAIGRVAIAWSGAHAVLPRLHARITGEPRIQIENSYEAVRHDASQRSKLLKAASNTWRDAGDASRLQELKDLLGRLDSLAIARNVAVHTMWNGLLVGSGENFRVIMHPRSKSPTDVLNLIGQPVVDYDAEFRQLAGDISALALLIYDFYERLAPSS